MPVVTEYTPVPKEIDISNHTESVSVAVKKLHPREKEYIEAGLKPEEIREKERTTEYHIPAHQRFFIWNAEQQNKLIDTLIRGYPIPDIIISDTGHRGDPKQIEDGQQRLTTLWRYFHNLFPYTPPELKDSPNPPQIYYSEIPKKAKGNNKLLSDIDPDAKRRLEDYPLKIKQITNSGDKSFLDKISEIFERLNAGKPLADGDKFWNRKNTSVVTRAIQLGQDERLVDLLKSVFNLDITKLLQSKGKPAPKTQLCALVGMILGLVIPVTYDFSDAKKVWPDIMTTSFLKVCEVLNLEITDEQYENAVLGLETICLAIKNAPQGDMGSITPKHNASFNRHLGVMIYDWREKTELYEDSIIPEDSEEVQDYLTLWGKIIGYFQLFEEYNDVEVTKCNIAHKEHPIQNIYLGKDRPNKNTDIGKNIIQRHGRMMELYPDWID